MKPPLPAREAGPASTAWNAAKTLAQTVVFWGVFLFLLPALILWLERWVGLDGWRWSSAGTERVGIALFAVMGGLGLWCGWIMARHGGGTPLPFDCARRLVVAGPYRHVRNPMAIAGIGQGIAVGVWAGSWPVMAYALAGAVAWDLVVRRWEEFDLEARFGAPYVKYRDCVRCWRPRVRPYTSEGRSP